MMDDTIAAILREPFPAETIGKLPRITCKACSEKHCQQHSRSQCSVCRNYISNAHIHLDYVGHAATTDRLLKADPGWTWEPVAFDANGLPAFDAQRGLWIKLTVAGVTRLGYGDGKSPKECIGDAIRNAAMRFGVALDLWAKEDLHTQQEQEPRQESPDGDPMREAKARVWREAQKRGMDEAALKTDYATWACAPLSEASVENLHLFAERLAKDMP